MRWHDDQPRAAVADADFKRFLRFPPQRAFEGPLAENADWTRAWYRRAGRPWWSAQRIERFEATPTGVRLEGETFAAPALAERAAHAEMALVVAVSAGPELDAEAQARWAAGEPDRYFFLESWGGAVVAALLGEAGDALAVALEQPRRRVNFGYAPGFRGWSIEDTPRLLALIATPLPGPLDVLSSGMLVPKKSQLAVFFVESPL